MLAQSWKYKNWPAALTRRRSHEMREAIDNYTDGTSYIHKNTITKRIDKYMECLDSVSKYKFIQRGLRNAPSQPSAGELVAIEYLSDLAETNNMLY